MCAVEWKKIWQVTIWDKRFSGIDKKLQPKVIKYHYYLANELKELERAFGDIRILYTTEQIAYTDSMMVSNNISEGEIVAIPWGGNASVKYFKGKFITADNRIATSSDIATLNNKYLYYWMLHRKDELEGYYRGAGIKHPSMYSVLMMDIPIPSLAKQQEIVSHLDTFTSLISNLESELDMRRKQYEHYRNQLLDFEGVEGVEWKTLGEICEIRGRIGFRGYTREDQVEEGEGVLSLSPGNIVNGKMDYNNSTYITWQKYEESPEIKTYNGDIIFCKTGSTVGKVSIVNKLPYKATINPQLVVLKEITINSKFLFYTLGTFRIQSLIKALAGVGSVPNISQAKLSEFKIHLPSTQTQQEIVSKLDAFENLIQSLEQEIKLRKQQYEYYREKLLTFE